MINNIVRLICLLIFLISIQGIIQLMENDKANEENTSVSHKINNMDRNLANPPQPPLPPSPPTPRYSSTSTTGNLRPTMQPTIPTPPTPLPTYEPTVSQNPTLSPSVRITNNRLVFHAITYLI